MMERHAWQQQPAFQQSHLGNGTLYPISRGAIFRDRVIIAQTIRAKMEDAMAELARGNGTWENIQVRVSILAIGSCC